MKVASQIKAQMEQLGASAQELSADAGREYAQNNDRKFLLPSYCVCCHGCNILEPRLIPIAHRVADQIGETPWGCCVP